VHELKANLRAGIFRVRVLNTMDEAPRFVWEARPVMPWRTVLAELVGYVKHAQSQLTGSSYCPLMEMRRLNELAAQQLRARIDELVTKRQELTVKFIKDTQVPDPYVEMWFKEHGLVPEGASHAFENEENVDVMLRKLENMHH
jgi:hypothetical protein